MNFKNNSFFNSIPIVVKNLLIINVLLFLATITLPKTTGIDLQDILGLHYFSSEKFNPIQLFTYMFMHGGFEHLFFNMFSLFIFGRTLEMVWGQQKFLTYYIITGVGAALIQEAFWYIELRPIINEINNLATTGIQNGVNVGSDIIYSVPELFAWRDAFLAVGASGSIFGLLLAFGMIFPNVPIFLLFIPIPIKAKYFVIFYGIFELFAGVRSVSGVGDGIAHFAHLGGMLFGYLLIIYWRKYRK